MPDTLILLAGWGCVGLGLLFTLIGARLLREERRRQRRPLPDQLVTGREVLLAGVAVALLGIGNVIGGWWQVLVIPAVAIMLLLLARLLTRRTKRKRQTH